MSYRDIPKVSLKDRIAALGLEGHGAASSTSATNGTTSNQPSASLSAGSNSTPAAGVRDKAARFESIGGVPVPRGSFGLGAPPAFSNLRKTGELYGNRIPSGSSRSPGSSPGRSPADESGAPEFTRIRLRSIGSAGSLGDGSEIEPLTRIQVIPPTPAFPPPEFSPKKDTFDVENTAPASEQAVMQAPPDQTADSSPLVPAKDKAQELEIPTNIPRLQELDSIPESPSTEQHASTSAPPTKKTSTAVKRRSLVLKQPTTDDLDATATSPNRPPSPQSSAAESSNPRNPKLSSSAVPSTSGPRKARSQAPSRASSVASTDSVFTSPPSDEGEISGGGIIGSPTLETVNTDGWGKEESTQVHSPSAEEFTEVYNFMTEVPDQPTSPLSTHITTSSTFNATPDMVASEKKSDAASERGSLLAKDDFLVDSITPNEMEPSQKGAEGATETFTYAPSAHVPQEAPLSSYPTLSSPSDPAVLIHDNGSPVCESASLSLVDASNNESLAESSTSSTVDGLSPVTAKTEKGSDIPTPANLSATRDQRELLAETASPAKVMRELRQLGMEKQSAIIIVPSKRASILSMMIPTLIGSDAVHGENRSAEEYTTSRETKSSPSFNEMQSLMHTEDAPRESMSEPPPLPKKDHLTETRLAGRDLSPTATSIMSTPQSFSGTSDASYARLSFASSFQEMVSGSSTIPDSEPARPSSEYTPSFLAPPSPNSFIPFVSESQNETRGMTPSPPPSFRSLYASGRLPPSSRGPGPHMPSGKIPLLQRAVTLMSRSLPPLTKDEAPPRRSSSTFHAIRLRTSSKAKREQAKTAQANASERASTSSDITITDDSPPRLELVQPRARTTSSPLVISTSRSMAPPVPSLPPVVLVNDAHPTTPPIARLFMDQRSSQQQNQPPTAFRESSPTLSISSAQASMSSCAGNPSHLFSPSFDEGIFDAFPEVPGYLPSSSVVARHSRLMAAGAQGRSHLGILPNRSFSELEDQMTGNYSGRAEPSKSQDGHIGMLSRRDESFNATIKSVRGAKHDEFGKAASAEISPVRRKTPSRKLIPGWYDDDDDDNEGDNETGWASVQVIRSRLM